MDDEATVTKIAQSYAQSYEDTRAKTVDNNKSVLGKSASFCSSSSVSQLAKHRVHHRVHQEVFVSSLDHCLVLPFGTGFIPLEVPYPVTDPPTQKSHHPPGVRTMLETAFALEKLIPADQTFASDESRISLTCSIPCVGPVCFFSPKTTSSGPNKPRTRKP